MQKADKFDSFQVGDVVQWKDHLYPYMSEFVVGAVYDLNGSMGIWEQVEIVRDLSHTEDCELRWIKGGEHHVNEWSKRGFVSHILNDPRVKMNEVSLAKRIIESYE